MFPPQYPTFASSRPFPCPNSLRNRCSTPQKHPAARVAVCVPLAIFRDVDSGVKERIGELVEKVRKKRENNVEPSAGAAKAIKYESLGYLCTSSLIKMFEERPIM